MSSPSSIDLPPRKKQKLNSSSVTSSPLVDSETTQIITIKKGDKISKRISQILDLLINQKKNVLLTGTSSSLQKLVSINEIVKSKLKEIPDMKFIQLNKLEKFETFQHKNEILSKKINVAILNILIKRVETDSQDDLEKGWTKQEI